MILLDLPLWKWLAIVEAWVWAAVKEEDHAQLEAELERPVHFTWIRVGGAQRLGSTPVAWQTNTKGEGLLSAHRKRAKVEVADG